MAKSLTPGLKGNAEVKRSSPFSTTGVPGTPIYGGYVLESEKNALLTGTQKYTKFSETLVNVAIVGAGVRYFLNLISKATWQVTPADDSDEAKELAEFVDNVANNVETPWRRVIRRAAMYRFYGFSLQEWTAVRRKDGRIGFKDIAPRPQPTIEKWDTDRIGTVKGVVQRSPQDGTEIYLARRKLMYLVDDSISDSPEGLGIVRHIYPYAERLKIYEKLEQDGFETDLRGIPIGRAPLAQLASLVEANEITAEQQTEWITNLTDFIQNHVRNPDTGLLLDSLTYQTIDEKGAPSTVKQWDLELLQSKTSGLPEIASAIRRVTRNIATLLGVEQLLLGETTGGSYALARDKTNVFFLIVDSTLAEISESLKKDFLEPLWMLNGFNEDLMPTMTPESIKFRDVEQVTKALKDMAQSGAKTSIADPAVNEIRELLGLSRVPDELVDQAMKAAEAATKALLENKKDPDESDGEDDLPDEGDDDGDSSRD
ncbi:MAG: phage portal protein family protein [Candidatus Thorarchaeota archaeon]